MYCYWCFVRFLLVFQFLKKFRTPFRFLGETEIKIKNKKKKKNKKERKKEKNFSLLAHEKFYFFCRGHWKRAGHMHGTCRCYISVLIDFDSGFSVFKEMLQRSTG